MSLLIPFSCDPPSLGFSAPFSLSFYFPLILTLLTFHMPARCQESDRQLALRLLESQSGPSGRHSMKEPVSCPEDFFTNCNVCVPPFLLPSLSPIRFTVVAPVAQAGPLDSCLPRPRIWGQHYHLVILHFQHVSRFYRRTFLEIKQCIQLYRCSLHVLGSFVPTV